MSVDYPRAWEIARAAAMEKHHPLCSFRSTEGGVLCDCDVIYDHPEYKDDVLQGASGVPCTRNLSAGRSNGTEGTQ